MTIQEALQELEMAIGLIEASKKSGKPEVVLEGAIVRLDRLRDFYLLKRDF